MDGLKEKNPWPDESQRSPEKVTEHANEEKVERDVGVRSDVGEVGEEGSLEN
jgi:hypothetical protein